MEDYKENDQDEALDFISMMMIFDVWHLLLFLRKCCLLETNRIWLF